MSGIYDASGYLLIGYQPLLTVGDPSAQGGAEIYSGTSPAAIVIDGSNEISLQSIDVSTKFQQLDASVIRIDASVYENILNINQLDASVIRIDLYNIIQDTSVYAEVNQIEASLALRITSDYVDGSIVAAVDAVDTSLVTYTDAAIVTALDSSFALYETKVNLDSSFVDVYTELVDVDTSLDLYLPLTGGTISGSLQVATDVSIFGNLHADGSVIIQTSNDASTYWLDIDVTGALVANIVS